MFLAGRMDIPGTQAIDLKFTTITASRRARVVVDLADVSFVATIGMRTLVSSAKALLARGGAMAFTNPQPAVRSALVAAGIHSLVPIFSDVEEACRVLQSTVRDESE